MPKIYDNIENFLVKGLNDTLEVSHRSDFCVGYFNLRGWKEVAAEIDHWDGGERNACRLLVGMQKAPSELVREYFLHSDTLVVDNAYAVKVRKELAQEFKDQLTIGIPTETDEVALRRLSAQIKNKKVVVKLFLRHNLHAKLYLCFRDDKINPIIGYLGSSNLTLAGLSKQGELNVDVLEQDAAVKLAKWFEDRWNDRWCIDISNELVEIIDNSWASEKLYSPYHVYIKMAYHLSAEARFGINEFRIPRVFQERLLDFQQKAVLIAAHHLHKRDGVMIGDVVGLGKTIIASALTKIFEDDFYLETLILCPKNIVPMWQDYKHKYQLRAEIMPISLAQTKLADLRRYRIVLIDESHNLRNREGKRYRAIREYIALNASKVILLTATPYNKTYEDLANQLRLFIEEDKDIGIAPENYLRESGGPIEFQASYQTSPRTLLAFEKSVYPDDWRELMRLFLVRRTRTFIKDNYALTDETNGRKYLLFTDGRKSYFPDRVPKRVTYSLKSSDPDDQYARLYSADVVDRISSLTLPRYGLGNYLDQSGEVLPTMQESIIQDNLSRAGKRLMGFARTNLFKRLESSGYAFLLSISRHILRNYIFIYAIENKLELPIGGQEANSLDEFLEDLDDSYLYDEEKKISLLFTGEDYYRLAAEVYEAFAGYLNRKFDWINHALFIEKLKTDLKDDARILLEVLNLGHDWNPAEDRKINSLYNLLTRKHSKEKILVFTQFADTANYLEKELTRRGLLDFANVTGATENPTLFAYRFSPVSNEKPEYQSQGKELRILISTDVLSEGQNLQDAHIVLNYDLPWAIIRLIQRAGRVDRIGQQSDKILCYSFWPEEGIERIIKLRSRLTQRIGENADVVGSDETFFEGDRINIENLYNEKAGILDDTEDTEVDLASYAYQIWKNAVDQDKSLLKTIPDLPNVVYATKAAAVNDFYKEGVIVYTKTQDDNDIMALVDASGEIITQSQYAILRTAECEPAEPAMEKLDNHHNLVAKAVSHIIENESRIGGQLGKKSGARYRVYHQLTRYYEEQKGTLFATDALRRAIEDIYKYPLKEYAKDTLNRHLRTGIDDQTLAALVISMRDDDKLCIVEEKETRYREPQIICTLGLKDESGSITGNNTAALPANNNQTKG
ncbi:MAG: NgoFVII family restriction endonuclease [Ignavibacteriaceae bacterium]|nr:NgoFVII family restriction endonuclease [Ignavibacteriaceae bacterium]